MRGVLAYEDRAPGYPLRLDYCFISSELSSMVSKAWVDIEATGSDHKPYWIEFNLESSVTNKG